MIHIFILGLLLRNKTFHLQILFLLWQLSNFMEKRQHVVSRSSSKAEYRALANATCEAQWLLYLHNGLGVQHTNSVNIYCDNWSTITLPTTWYFTNVQNISNWTAMSSVTKFKLKLFTSCSFNQQNRLLICLQYHSLWTILYPV